MWGESFTKTGFAMIVLFSIQNWMDGEINVCIVEDFLCLIILGILYCLRINVTNIY